jgi:AcrR family transcriptional regulator
LAIHEAAGSLVLERGLDEATVDAIAEAAGVSARTFFNYFAVKEDAVLGLREPFLGEELVAEFQVERDLLEQVSRLLLTVARTALDGGSRPLRQRLLNQYPVLKQRQMQYMLKAEGLVQDALARLLAADPAWSGGAAGFDVSAAARMLVLTGAVPIRFALTSADYQPGRGLTIEDITPAVTLFHHVQKKFS